MSSTNLPVALPTDGAALERALAVVAEESFFVMVEPVSGEVPAVADPCLAATVAFSGPVSGALCCRVPRRLACELTAAFVGESPADLAADDPRMDDMAGELANMVCGRWLTDVAPGSIFDLAHPVVRAASVEEVGATPPSGLMDGHPIWLELSVE